MKYLSSLNNSLYRLLSTDERVLLIGEDIIDPYGGAFKVTKGLSSKFPHKVITTPISEAGIVGLGTGLAMAGFKPIIEIMFGDFITLIADQIINSASKFNQMYNNQVNVPLVVRTPMGGRRGYGPTHSQTLETLFFNVPNIKILAPSIFEKPGRVLERVIGFENNPILFIENKTLYPAEIIEYSELFFITNTDINGYPVTELSIKSDDKSDCSIICYGGMASLAHDASNELFINEEINVNVIIPTLIKPVNVNDILSNFSLSNNILILEESNKYSGWGSELSAQFNEIGDYKCRRIGSKEHVIPSSKILENQVLPQKEDIIKGILDLL